MWTFRARPPNSRLGSIAATHRYSMLVRKQIEMSQDAGSNPSTPVVGVHFMHAKEQH